MKRIRRRLQHLVATKASGERVMTSITKFLSERLKLTVNQANSAVGRPWNRIFLGYTMSWHPTKARLKVGDKALAKFKDSLRKICKEKAKGSGPSVLPLFSIYVEDRDD